MNTSTYATEKKHLCVRNAREYTRNIIALRNGAKPSTGWTTEREIAEYRVLRRESMEAARAWETCEMTTKETAVELGISVNRVNHLCASRCIAWTKTGATNSNRQERHFEPEEVARYKRDRKNGRPRKDNATATNAIEPGHETATADRYI